MNNEKILILIGKSACGKDSIANYLMKNYNFNKAISFTTRPIREKEIEGREYFFTNKNNFDKMINNDEMIEHRSYNTLVNGNKDIWYYGLHKTKNNINFSKKTVLILDYEGTLNALNYFGTKNCYVVYVDSCESIRKNRALKRGSFDLTEWNRRVKADKYDFDFNKIKNISNLIVINEDKTINDVCKEIIDNME